MTSLKELLAAKKAAHKQMIEEALITASVPEEDIVEMTEEILVEAQNVEKPKAQLKPDSSAPILSIPSIPPAPSIPTKGMSVKDMLLAKMGKTPPIKIKTLASAIFFSYHEEHSLTSFSSQIISTDLKDYEGEDEPLQLSGDMKEIPLSINLNSMASISAIAPEEQTEILQKNKTFSLNIKLNAKQQLARELAFAGKSFCLIGPAGSGKTTAQREIAKSLLEQNALSTHYFRVQGAGERVPAPSVAFVAYTRIAAGNLRKAIHKDPSLEDAFYHNITTIHNLLEYEPEFYFDEIAQKDKMRFIPRRTRMNPLDITHLIIEEASMVDVAKLWPQLYDALRPGVQIIFLGDLNQLPPVFGASVLNYALLQLPIVELTEVYRQEGDSTVLENAHKILKGEYPLTEAGDFQIVRMGETQQTPFITAIKLSKMFSKLFKTGDYDPQQDIILSPFGKGELGTYELNRYIAQFLGDDRNAMVYEIRAGIAKHYLAVGDKIMYNKLVGEIVRITHNGDYRGTPTLPASNTLTRHGHYKQSDSEEDDFELEGYEGLDIDKIIEEGKEEDLLRQASHAVTIKLENDEELTLSAVGDFSPQIFSLGYALTVHKAQGCEWRTVYLVLHKCHSTMAFRELFYTAVTRAATNCVIFAKDFMVKKAIATQRIKGNTLKEKLEFFNSGAVTMSDVPILKTSL